MRTIVIYPGRFHPFHQGHQWVYQNLVKKFGNCVYIATSGKRVPGTAPFTFQEKKRFMVMAGVPENRIIYTRQPYRPIEITQHLDPKTTNLVFVASRKDSDRFKLMNRRGSTYMQPYTEQRAPFALHSYALVVPIKIFKIGDRTIKSATELRDMYHRSNHDQRRVILNTLYGKNGFWLKNLFDIRL